MGNFCEQYGLPPIALSRQKGNKKHDKVHKDYKYKKYRRRSTKPNNFYDKKKNVYKKHDKQKLGKGNCLNCGKFGHFSKDCKQKPGKLKNKLNMLDINDYLNNLRCPTMFDYKWYQDVFISRVMLQKDYLKPYWKEKFIVGLPPLFVHKVKEELTDNLNKKLLTKWVICLWLLMLILATIIFTMLKLLIFLLPVFLEPFAIGGKNILLKSLEIPSKRLLKKMMMVYPFFMKELAKVFMMESIL